jgi:flagellar motor switch protein FliM
MPTFLGILDLEQGDVLSLATDETATTSANSAQSFLFMVELLL